LIKPLESFENIFDEEFDIIYYSCLGGGLRESKLMLFWFLWEKLLLILIVGLGVLLRTLLLIMVFEMLEMWSMRSLRLLSFIFLLKFDLFSIYKIFLCFILYNLPVNCVCISMIIDGDHYASVHY